MTPRNVTFTPALPCARCLQPTRQRLITPMSSLAWQLVPLCERDIETSTGEEAACTTITDLQHRITQQLQVIYQLQRRRQNLACAYLHLRRQRAHSKAQRALRIGLNRASRRQTQLREEWLA
jgi:DNA segregation ATPase FtsK/SpoIIIE-like protein